MKTLNADIKSGKLKKAYLLFGNEPYLVRSYKTRLFSAAKGDDELNALALSGKEAADLPRLREFTDTLPFFAERRVLLLEDTGLFKASSEGFDRWIETLPDTAVVIFSERDVDKRNRLYKAVAKEGYAAELSHPDEKSLRSWLLAIVKSYGLNITVDACNMLTDLISEDMEYGRNELDKVCTYCLEKGAIEKKDVEEIASRKLQNRIFDLVSETSAGRRKAAMQLYYDLLSLREPPLRILALLARELDRLYVTKTLLSENRSRDEIAACLGLRPFIAGKMTDLVRRTTAEELNEAVEYALDLEKAVKTGDIADVLSVELLILYFSRLNSRERIRA